MSSHLIASEDVEVSCQAKASLEPKAKELSGNCIFDLVEDELRFTERKKIRSQPLQVWSKVEAVAWHLNDKLGDLGRKRTRGVSGRLYQSYRNYAVYDNRGPGVQGNIYASTAKHLQLWTRTGTYTTVHEESLLR